MCKDASSPENFPLLIMTTPSVQEKDDRKTKKLLWVVGKASCEDSSAFPGLESGKVMGNGRARENFVGTG